ncbi:MAG: hypothetical protein NC489_27860 [Ruminococcus flavefaciens]|nr:hypothetical protein [Ruminococcus flavefaciens]
MKKAGKISVIVAGSCIMFIIGICYAGRVNYEKKQEEISLAGETVSKRGYSVNVWNKELTEDEELFLQEHVMGAWSFSERVIALEGKGADTANFSGQALEELENIWIVYHKDVVQQSGYRADTFSKVEDIYLFAAYGGMSPVRSPVYHIENNVDEKRLALRHIGADGGVYYAPFPEECELIHVFYDLGYEGEYPAVDTYYYADDFYVDPADPKVLYLNFGGLWKLERQLDTYDSGGKSATG